jgi:hypothetical protein
MFFTRNHLSSSPSLLEIFCNSLGVTVHIPPSKKGDRSIAVKRALADFGAEESFGQAAKRFKEHYGWTVERGACSQVILKN